MTMPAMATAQSAREILRRVLGGRTRRDERIVLRYGKYIPAYDSQIDRFLTASDLWWDGIKESDVDGPVDIPLPCSQASYATYIIRYLQTRNSYILDRTLRNRRCHCPR